MKKQVVECDLCGAIIVPYNPKGNGMIFDGQENQIWPTEKDFIDVCSKCCLILHNAQTRGVATLDTSELVKRAGFVYDQEKRVWIPKSLPKFRGIFDDTLPETEL